MHAMPRLIWARFPLLSRSSSRRDGWTREWLKCPCRRLKIYFMRRYEALEMGNVIKYQTHDVLCLVAALVLAIIKISTNTHWLYLQWSCITDGPDSRLFKFTLAVNNHSSGWLNFKNIPSICQLLQANVNVNRFLSLKRSKTQSRTTSNNTFAPAFWNLLQEKEIYAACSIRADNHLIGSNWQ